MNNKFRHFGITVSDLESTLAFYCKGLGFKEELRLEREEDYTQRVTGVPGTPIKGAIVSMGNIQIEFLEYSNIKDKPSCAAPVCYPGIAHICITVSSIKNTMETITNLGGVFQGDPVVVPSGLGKGNRVVYGWDPQMIPFELVQIKGEERA